MRLFLYYHLALYSLMVVLGFFGLFNSISPCKIWGYIPDFWLSIILIIGGALGVELSVWEVNMLEDAKQH